MPRAAVMLARERAAECGVDTLGRRYVPKRLQHRVLDDVILDHVDRRFKRSSMEIYTRVVDDYGTVNVRVFYQHLRQLRKRRRVKVVDREGGKTARLFYVKVR